MSADEAVYQAQLSQEGQHWMNVSLDQLKRGIIPYCCDFRLHVAQLVEARKGLPFHLGAGLLPTRFREVRNVLGGACRAIEAGRRDVLDLGCGGGWLSLELARQGAAVRGLDISKDNLALARFFAERHERSLPFLYPRLAGMPLRSFGSVTYDYADLNRPLAMVGSESADVVTVWDSLHHVKDLGTTMAEAARALRPGGFLVGHDFVGPEPAAVRLGELVNEGVRQMFRTLSAAELGRLRRHVVEVGRLLLTDENAIDTTTRSAPGTAAYIAEVLQEAEASFALKDRPVDLVPSPFEEVSIAYLMTELGRAFDVTAFYSMGAYFPEDMPPPPSDADGDDGGGQFFHYLSYLMLLFDDVLVDAGVCQGRYICFVAVPKGKSAPTPGLRRSLSALLERPAAPGSGPPPDHAAVLRDRVRFLEAENRILRRLAYAPASLASDAGRFYFKIVRPLLLSITSRVRAGGRYRGA